MGPGEPGEEKIKPMSLMEKLPQEGRVTVRFVGTPPARSSGDPQNLARYHQGLPMPTELWAAGQAWGGGLGPCLAA